jgi:hypothetical protein
MVGLVMIEQARDCTVFAARLICRLVLHDCKRAGSQPGSGLLPLLLLLLPLLLLLLLLLGVRACPGKAAHQSHCQAAAGVFRCCVCDSSGWNGVAGASQLRHLPIVSQSVCCYFQRGCGESALQQPRCGDRR